MFAGSRFCARCGAEATREAVDDATPLKCPRCGGSLQSLRLGQTPVRECSDCGGLWVDPATLQQLCDAREDHAAMLSALATREPSKPGAPETVRYIPCPRCAKLMNRVNFARSSGVVLDVCKTHGVWLDRGELQRVVGFVEHGGLSAARERERAQLEDERRRLEAAKSGLAASGAGVAGLSISFTTHVTSRNSSVELLLRDALGLFIGS
jgi:Zn-finger nucleic acid-binding protein